MIRYDSTTIGTMVLKQGGKRFKLQIRKGKCLAVIIYVRKLTDEEMLENQGSKYMHTLYDFYLDGKHLSKRLKKEGDVLGKDIVDVEFDLRCLISAARFSMMALWLLILLFIASNSASIFLLLLPSLLVLFFIFDPIFLFITKINIRAITSKIANAVIT